MSNDSSNGMAKKSPYTPARITRPMAMTMPMITSVDLFIVQVLQYEIKMIPNVAQLSTDRKIMQEASARWNLFLEQGRLTPQIQSVRTVANKLTGNLYSAYINEDFMRFAGRANSRVVQIRKYKKVSPPGQTVGSTKTVVFGLITPSTGKVLLRRGVTSPMHSMHWRRGTQVGI